MPLRPKQLVSAAFSLLLFVYLAHAVSAGTATTFDSTVRQTIHSWSFPALTTLMLVFTFLGRDGFLATLGVPFIWYLVRKNRRTDAIRLAAIPLTAELLLQILKEYFHRARPEPFFNLATPGSFSFPSGHALMSTVFYLTLATVMTTKPAIRAAAVALAGCIGLSRVYLGVHYPTDVLAGFAAGAFWFVAGSWLFAKIAAEAGSASPTSHKY